MSIGPWDFNGFDIVVLLIIIISLFMAASRGLFRELISVTALIIAGGLALFIFGRFRFAAQDFISPAWLADGALGLGTFAISYMVIVFILSGVGKSLKGKDIGFVDRLLGAGFGAGRGLIVASLFVMVLTAQYRASQDAQDFKDYMAQNQAAFPPDVLEKMPKSMKEQLEAPPAQLPAMFEKSIFFPILDTIGDGIRKLPFAKVKTMAERLKEGDIDAIIKDVR